MKRPASPLFPRLSRVACLLAVLTAGQAQAGLFDDDEARKQIADIRAKFDVRFDQQAQAQLDLAGQIQRLNEEIARLRGVNEVLTNDLETARKRQQDFYIDLDNRLRHLESAAVAAAEEAAKPKAPVIDPAAESQDYEAALSLFKANKFKEAAAALTAFAQKYPDGSLAANAQYWLGNAWYAQRDCRKAIEVQSALPAKWPTSPKAPDALLVVATCQQEMGNPAAAKRTLDSLIASYPGTPAADQAKQRSKK